MEFCGSGKDAIVAELKIHNLPDVLTLGTGSLALPDV
jgi:hypothetical protein